MTSSVSSVDAACREAIERFRLEAFDNVNVEALLRPVPLPLNRLFWIGRQLMRHGRSAEAYEAGQRILNLMNAADVA